LINFAKFILFLILSVLLQLIMARREKAATPKKEPLPHPAYTGYTHRDLLMIDLECLLAHETTLDENEGLERKSVLAQRKQRKDLKAVTIELSRGKALFKQIRQNQFNDDELTKSEKLDINDYFFPLME
jgi:hypothetical protein